MSKLCDVISLRETSRLNKSHPKIRKNSLIDCCFASIYIYSFTSSTKRHAKGGGGGVTEKFSDIIVKVFLIPFKYKVIHFCYFVK